MLVMKKALPNKAERASSAVPAAMQAGGGVAQASKEKGYFL
jgi:hypothetical protein